MAIDSIHTKRVLFTGLQPFLRDSQLNEAIYLWECKYAKAPTFSLRYYVNELQKSISLNVAPKTLFMNIMKTMALPENELLPDPTPRVNAYLHNRRLTTEPV